MEATTEKSKLPTWIPLVIRENVFDLIQPKNKKERVILKRLLTDKKMRNVWNELTKHKRDPLNWQTTKEPYYKPRDRTIGWSIDSQGCRQPLDKMSLDDALLGLLIEAYELAVNPVSSMTYQEAMRAYEEFADIRKRLVEDGRFIRKQLNDPQIRSLFILWQLSSKFPKKHFSREKIDPLNDYIEATFELAQFFDDALTNYETGVPEQPPFYYRPQGERRPLVRRSKARDEMRSYVLQLAKTCKNLFDAYLYGIVAEVSSVALQNQITADYVRKVVKTIATVPTT